MEHVLVVSKVVASVVDRVSKDVHSAVWNNIVVTVSMISNQMLIKTDGYMSQFVKKQCGSGGTQVRWKSTINKVPIFLLLSLSLFCSWYVIIYLHRLSKIVSSLPRFLPVHQQSV